MGKLLKRIEKIFVFIALSLLLTFLLPNISPIIQTVKVTEAAVMKLNIRSKRLTIGDTTLLKVINRDKKIVTWRSSNKKVAIVYKGGTIKAIGVGKCKITGTVGTTKLVCTLTVDDIFINLKSATMEVDVYQFLTLNGISENDSVEWSSSDEKIAKVYLGLVSSLSEGVVTITAKVNKREYTCNITVINNSNKISYLTNRNVQYSKLDKCHTLFFALQDINYNNVTCSGIINIRIVNDSGEIVYDETRDITSKSFKYWTSSLSITKLLCSVDIPDSDIFAGSSKTGIMYFTITGSGYNFDELKIPVSDLPYISETNNCTLTIPTIPLTTSYYINGKCVATYRIDDLQYFFTETFDNKVDLTLTLSGEKLLSIYDSARMVEYKLYKDGYVIKSGDFIFPDMEVGEKIIQCQEILYNLEPGNYEMEITDNIQ